MERSEMVTDDLFKMYWIKLLGSGSFIPTKEVTCEWISHPFQRHNIIINRSSGNLNKYRSFYNVGTPLKFCASGYNYVDEEKLYQDFRKKTVPQKNGLKILLVGELSYHPERIYALEEAGHQLYGLWTKDPFYGMVGPIPFGNVKNVPHSDWRNEMKKIKPDIIYALLNFTAVPFAHEVLTADTGIPFVWHFKESPYTCRQLGTWDKLCDLFSNSDGQIFTSPGNERLVYAVFARSK